MCRRSCASVIAKVMPRLHRSGGKPGERRRTRRKSRPSASRNRSPIRSCHSKNVCRTSARRLSAEGLNDRGARKRTLGGGSLNLRKRRSRTEYAKGPSLRSPRDRASAIARSISGMNSPAVTFKWSKHSAMDQRSGAGRQLNCASVRAEVSPSASCLIESSWS